MCGKSDAGSMGEVLRIKTKVCLVGEAAVGKTSLVRRYVLDEFDSRHITTPRDVGDWVQSVFNVVGEIPVVYAINKIDLKDEVMILYGDKEIEQAARAFDAPHYYTSARTGENVESAFRNLGGVIPAKEGLVVARPKQAK